MDWNLSEMLKYLKLNLLKGTKTNQKCEQTTRWRQIIIFCRPLFLCNTWHFVYLSSSSRYFVKMYEIHNNIKKTFVRNIWCEIRLKIVCNKYDLYHVISFQEKNKGKKYTRQNKHAILEIIRLQYQKINNPGNCIP